MKKIKCDVCEHWTGGFHLCIGPNASKEFKVSDRIYGPARIPTQAELKARGAMGRWEAHWEENKERDPAILEMYEEGYSLAQVGKKFNVNKMGVKSIVIRLGGTIRPRNAPRIKETA